MSLKKWACVVLVGIVAFGVSLALLSLLTTGRPATLTLASSVSPLPLQSHNTAHFNEMNRLLGHTMPRRKPWGTSDATLLVDLFERDLGAPPMPDEEFLALPEAQRIEVMERMLISSQAYGLAIEALRLEHPMDAEARELLEGALIEMLDHAQPGVRIQGTSAVVQTGMIRDAAIRSRIEAMKTDPDPLVAANAARQLTHYDRLVAVQRRFGAVEPGCASCPDTSPK